VVKNKMIIFILIMAAIAILAFSGLQKTPKEQNGHPLSGLPMKIAGAYWPGSFWVLIAEKKGWFKEAGLNVEVIFTDTDYFVSLDNMVEGRMDQNNFSLFDYIIYLSQNRDLVFILNPDNSSGVEAIVARPGIETIHELKGKKIAVALGTYLEYELDIFLENQGLSSREVIKVNMHAEKMVRAFAENKVDAIITWEPFVSEAVEKEKGIKLIDTSQIPGMSPNGNVFHRRFIQERPGDVQAYVRVWHKTTQFIKENPDPAFTIIANMYNKTIQEVQTIAQLDKLLDLQDNLTAFSYGSGLNSLHGSWKQMNNFMAKKKVIEKRLKSIDYLDSSWIRNLDQP
jgi:NitT/TauT family transport system substrate-binding protein